MTCVGRGSGGCGCRTKAAKHDPPTRPNTHVMPVLDVDEDYEAPPSAAPPFLPSPPPPPPLPPLEGGDTFRGDVAQAILDHAEGNTRPYREVFDEIREDARRKDDMVNAMIREAMTWEHYSRGIPAIDLLMFRKMLEAALDSAR